MIVIDGTTGITTSNITISTGAGQTNITSTGISTPSISAVDSSSKIPGEIFKFAGSVAPAGCLACPTVPTNISRTTYAKLFAAIGTTWGSGDGSTTFGMPYVPTGYSTVQGTPGSQTVGSVISHTHSLVSAMGQWYSGVGYSAAAPFANSAYNPSISATGGAANLAAGMGVMYCVKF